jgi:hypothetical protein
MATSRPRFLLFPRDDDRFRHVIESLAAREVAATKDLEQHLRTAYPRAVVRRRDRLAELESTAETWYVYRDGSPTSHA